MTIQSLSLQVAQHRNLAGCSFAALMVCTLPAPLLAQAAPAAAATPVVASTQADVGDIVVTARRHQERVQDAPLAITAASAAKLDSLHINDASQVATITPGLTFSNAAFVPQPTIRGVGTRTTGIGDESIVPLYVDGVYQPFLPGVNLKLNNIERIEVLKGPQGALYGRNSIGGAINVVTQTPSVQTKGDFSISYGAENEVIAKGYLSGGSDIVAVSLAAVGTRDDGYVRDITNGLEYGWTRSWSVLPRILIKPTDRLTLDFSANYSFSKDTVGNIYRPIDGNTSARRFDPTVPIASAPYTASETIVPFTQSREISASSRIGYRTDVAQITLINAYQDSKTQPNGDSDGSIVDVARSSYTQISQNHYHELYATSEASGPFQWIVGATYFHDLSGSRPLDAYTRNLTTGVVGQTHVVGSVTTDSLAFYAQGTYTIANALSVIAAGRYTTERKDLDVLAGTTTITHITNGARFKNFSPSLTLQYRPDENLNLYIKASRGFKSGVYNVNATTAAAAQTVRPETLTQYEAGLKVRPASWIRMEASIYLSNYHDIQVNARDPVTSVIALENGGREKIYGGEAAIFIQPTARLNLNAGLALLHGRYEAATALQVFVPAVVGGVVVPGNTAATIDASGKTIIKAPDATVNAGGDYAIPLASGSVHIAVNAYYTGTSYWDVANRFRQDPYTLVDGTITWKPGNGRFGVSLWGRNLLNTYYNRTETFSTFGDFLVPGKPRTYGVELRYAW